MSKLSESKIARLCQQYARGATIATLSERYDISRPKVARVLRANHVTVRPRGRQPAHV